MVAMVRVFVLVSPQKSPYWNFQKAVGTFSPRQTLLQRDADSRAKPLGSGRCTRFFRDTFYFPELSADKPTQPVGTGVEPHLLDQDAPKCVSSHPHLLAISAASGSKLAPVFGEKKTIGLFFQLVQSRIQTLLIVFLELIMKVGGTFPSLSRYLGRDEAVRSFGQEPAWERPWQGWWRPGRGGGVETGATRQHVPGLEWRKAH